MIIQSRTEGNKAAEGGLLPNSIIWTPEIERINSFVTHCVQHDLPGCAVGGSQRIGKSKLLLYMTELLKQTIGYPVATVLWTIEHEEEEKSRPRTIRQFVQDRMADTDSSLSMVHRDVAVLKKRLIDRLHAIADEDKSQVLVLMIDEAQDLTEQEYLFLVSLQNKMDSLKRVRLFVFLIGQPNLLEVPRSWRATGGQHVLGRFFSRTSRVRGVALGEEMGQVFESFDEHTEDGSRISWRLFPYLAGSDWSFSKWEPQFSHGMTYIKQLHNIECDLSLPVQYCRSALIGVIKHCLRTTLDPRHVQDALAVRAIVNSGFVNFISYYAEQDRRGGDDGEWTLDEPEADKSGGKCDETGSEPRRVA
jgi:hypothetical protein